MRADHTRHILDHAEDREIHHLDKLDGLRRIQNRDILGGRHDHSAFHVRCELDDIQRLVTGSRRKIHDQIIEIAPFHVAEELFGSGRLHRSAPDNGTIGLVQKKGHRDDFKRTGHLHRHDVIADRLKTEILDPEHLADRRTVEIEIQKTGLISMVGKCIGKIYRDGTFPDPAFSGEDKNDVTYVDIGLFRHFYG